MHRRAAGGGGRGRRPAMRDPVRRGHRGGLRPLASAGDPQPAGRRRAGPLPLGAAVAQRRALQPGGQRRRRRGAGFPQVAVESGAILTIVSLLQRTPLLSAMPLRVARSLAARGQLAILPLALQAKLHPVGIMTRRQAAAATELSTDAARRRKWCAMRRRSASGLRRRRRRADAAAVARPRPTGAVRRWRRSAAGARPSFLQPQGRQAHGPSRRSQAPSGNTPMPSPAAIISHMASKLRTWMRRRSGSRRPAPRARGCPAASCPGSGRRSHRPGSA